MVMQRVWAKYTPHVHLEQKKKKNKNPKNREIFDFIFNFFLSFYSQLNHFLYVIWGMQIISWMCWLIADLTVHTLSPVIHWKKTEHRNEKWTTAALMYSISKYKGKPLFTVYSVNDLFYSGPVSFIDYPRHRPFTCDAEKKYFHPHTVQYDLSASSCAKSLIFTAPQSFQPLREWSRGVNVVTAGKKKKHLLDEIYSLSGWGALEITDRQRCCFQSGGEAVLTDGS